MIELETQLLIDGQFVAGAARNAFTVISPITGQTYAEVASAGPEDPRPRCRSGSPRVR